MQYISVFPLHLSLSCFSTLWEWLGPLTSLCCIWSCRTAAQIICIAFFQLIWGKDCIALLRNLRAARGLVWSLCKSEGQFVYGLLPHPCFRCEHPTLEKGLSSHALLIDTTQLFHSLIPAGVCWELSEQNSAPWVPAPTRSCSLQQHLYSVSVALVTWASWPGHFAGYSLVLPFIFNQIVKIRYQRLTCTCSGPRATILDTSTTRNPGSGWCIRGTVGSEGLDGSARAFFFCLYELQVRIHLLEESSWRQ